MGEQQIFEIPAATKERTWIDNDTYLKMYQESIDDPKSFWDKQAERLDWFKKWDTTLNWDFNKADIRWYEGGKLNVSYNCLDRHLETRGDQTALIWESDDPNVDRTFSYKELHAEVSKFANVMKSKGIEKGDRVMIYMPMIPELAIACLACTRIGAVHSVVFGGFSAEALKNRILDCGGKMLITANAGVRGGKSVPLKQNADQAMEGTNTESCMVVKHTDDDCNMQAGRDFFWHEEMASASADCPAEEMDAEDPLFILYTSGSTGKPKGVLHTTAGYLVYTSLTHQYVFDYHDGDIYWCTADIGWVTGHSYILYGPLANGATTLMFEGVPNYPDFGRFWDICDKHKVNIFYTAPTAIRAIAKEGEELVNKRDLSSLRLLGTVGEPINPEAWLWYHRVVGHEKCPIVDTWWQTETGGIMITPLPGATATKPGSATRPFFGIQPLLVDADGNELEGATEGNLCIKHSWPGQMRTVYGDHERFIQTYFSTYKGLYFTGDGCRRDEDGYYWITGRVDDVLNVSGHRMGTAEIESALVLHETVAEAAIVGFPHEIKGQGIYAYVTLNTGVEPTAELKKELVQLVRKEIGPIANLDVIQWAPGLPKTRSGKIMRRILRKIAENDMGSIGDTSTLADPSVVEDLIANRPT
ncbi:MAG: acetate--CoA ligase [SAR324 cluster bacterium]|nr:acetate--CoA ligase [SAR324 cluster bacterium]MBL7034363.1 acetate--CoA ligase [SAR324 cluster bacterium]